MAGTLAGDCFERDEIEGHGTKSSRSLLKSHARLSSN